MKLRVVTASLFFHVTLIGAMGVGIHFSEPIDIAVPPPMIVEFAKIDEITQAPKQPEFVQKAPPPKRAEPKKPKNTKPDKPKKPKAAPRNTAETPVNIPPRRAKPAPPEPKKEPPKTEKAEVIKPPKPNIKPASVKRPPKPKVEEKKPPKKEKEPEAQEVAQRNFGSVLKNLAEVEESSVEAEETDNAQVDDQPPSQIIPLGQRLTMSEIDALRAQLERCWNVPIGARGVEDMPIRVELRVSPERVVQDARIQDMSRYRNDSFFRAVADTAIRAVRSPKCSPLNLPTDKYNSWKAITVTFNPKDMF